MTATSETKYHFEQLEIYAKDLAKIINERV